MFFHKNEEKKTIFYACIICTYQKIVVTLRGSLVLVSTIFY